MWSQRHCLKTSSCLFCYIVRNNFVYVYGQHELSTAILVLITSSFTTSYDSYVKTSLMLWRHPSQFLKRIPIPLLGACFANLFKASNTNAWSGSKMKYLDLSFKYLYSIYCMCEKTNKRPNFTKRFATFWYILKLSRRTWQITINVEWIDHQD